MVTVPVRVLSRCFLATFATAAADRGRGNSLLWPGAVMLARTVVYVIPLLFLFLVQLWSDSGADVAILVRILVRVLPNG